MVTVCEIGALTVGRGAGTVLDLLVLDFLRCVRGSSHFISRSVYGCMSVFITVCFFAVQIF